MTNIFTLMIVMILAYIAFIIIQMSLENKYIVLYMTFIAFCITIFEWVTNQTIRFSMFVIQVNILDILTIYLIIVSFFYTYKRKKNYDYPKIIKYSLYLAMSIFLISLLRGILNNPLNSVIEDIRRMLQSFFIPVICFMNIPIYLEDTKTQKIIGNFIKCIVIYCLICWILDIGLGIKIMRAQSDAGTTMRVIGPEQTLVIAMIAIYSIYNDLKIRKKRYISMNSFILVGTVILLQHRSVWMAMLIGLIYIILTCSTEIETRGITISSKYLMQLHLLLIIIPILYIIFKDSQLVLSLETGLKGIRGEEGSTLSYRFKLWKAHLNSLNMTEWIIGKPFGNGYYIYLENYGRDITPHSGYIHTIIRSGVVGISFIVLFLINLIKYCRKRRVEWGVAICFMLLVFWYPYTYNFYPSIVLAFIIKSVRNSI